MTSSTFRGILIVVLALVLAWISSPLSAQEEPPDGEHLLGLWGGHERFGPTVDGTLVLGHHPGPKGEEWWAEIAGFRVPVRQERGVLSFTLPGDLGSFRGRLEEGVDPQRGTLHGQWIQPWGISTFGQRFSTPVELAAIAPGWWRGQVRPLEG